VAGQQLPGSVLCVDGVVLASKPTFHGPRWAGDLVDLVALVAQVARQSARRTALDPFAGSRPPTS
jgi:hypothetical protein